MPGEFELINWIRQQTALSPEVKLGIGDDAAEIEFVNSGRAVVTVDMLMEGTHFELDKVEPELVGRKALAVNLSDLAAMAAKPVAVVVSYALPRHHGKDLAKQLHSGIQQLADQYEVVIAGGDTNSWAGPLVISITAMGRPLGVKTVKRSGAEVGDSIFVTGTLGGSRASHQFKFEPRLKEAEVLYKAVDLHAMIDLSDGLSSDLGHLLKESGVGAILDADAVPVSDAAKQLSSDPETQLQHALNDGEDFELLFTVSAKEGEQLLKNSPLEIPLTKVGEITPGDQAFLRSPEDGLSPLTPEGWSHRL